MWFKDHQVSWDQNGVLVRTLALDAVLRRGGLRVDSRGGCNSEKLFVLCSGPQF